VPTGVAHHLRLCFPAERALEHRPRSRVQGTGRVAAAPCASPLATASSPSERVRVNGGAAPGLLEARPRGREANHAFAPRGYACRTRPETGKQALRSRVIGAVINRSLCPADAERLARALNEALSRGPHLWTHPGRSQALERVAERPKTPLTAARSSPGRPRLRVADHARDEPLQMLAPTLGAGRSQLGCQRLVGVLHVDELGV
jgi:hypothetical protein